MAFLIRPSPALIVRADLSVAECVKKMRDRKVGSVLVVSDDESLELVGIFTERDLIYQIDRIEQGRHWTKPVRTVMTRPVVTIEPSELHSAGRLMLKRGFRHLPVVVRDENGKSQLVGVVSMRDLFKAFVRDQADQPSDPRVIIKKPRGTSEKRGIGILSRDPAYLELLKQSFASLSARIPLRKISAKRYKLPGGGLESLHDLSAILIDIDQGESAEWAAFLRLLNRDAECPQVFVVFDPEKHSRAETAVLKKLGESGKFSVFAKPVDVYALLSRISRAV